jgi:hypothetical protein
MKTVGNKSVAHTYTILRLILISRSLFKQEDHDGPEIAHMYVGPMVGANYNPELLFEQTW